jgi:hypothetical protein
MAREVRVPIGLREASSTKNGGINDDDMMMMMMIRMRNQRFDLG